MAIAPVSSAVLNPPTSAGGTSPNFNSIGSNLIILSIPWYIASPTITDNMGNTYTQALTKIDGAGVATLNIYYKKNPATSATHTVTVAGSLYSSMTIDCFSGVDTTFGIDQISAGGNSTSPSVQPGSVTAGANGSLIYTGACVYGGNSVGFAVNSGMTPSGQVVFNSGVCFGTFSAYLIQGTAAAINPTVSDTSPSVNGMAAGTITFRPSAASGLALAAAGKTGSSGKLGAGTLLLLLKGKARAKSSGKLGLSSFIGVLKGKGRVAGTGKLGAVAAIAGLRGKGAAGGRGKGALLGTMTLRGRGEAKARGKAGASFPLSIFAKGLAKTAGKAGAKFYLQVKGKGRGKTAGKLGAVFLSFPLKARGFAKTAGKMGYRVLGARVITFTAYFSRRRS